LNKGGRLRESASPLLSCDALGLTRDGWILFAARFVRMFAYGALSVILVLYLTDIGFEEGQVGLLLSLTLVGDTVLSLFLTTRADRWGRRKTLLAGAALMSLAGVAFGLSRNFFILLAAATIGVISPSGLEVGPFLPVEQAALSQILSAERRTRVFSWYSLTGSIATALGSLGGGVVSELLQRRFLIPAAGFRTIIVAYALFGLLLAAIFSRLSPSIEVQPLTSAGVHSGASLLGVRRSRKVVGRLSGLFALDSFAGGFVIQSLAAYWFHLRFGMDSAALGSVFFGANIFAGLSALAAARLASRFGLINTMVFTHLPSNVLLILVPLMPGKELAIALLLLRFSISQMDVPTRQSYLMAVVSPEERSAAAGVTGVARTTGASVAPVFAGMLLGNPVLFNVPFYLAGSLKILYDLLLYRSFISLKPPEERDRSRPGV
jgi:MFS family permease